jgi:hypothetical protein
MGVTPEVVTEEQEDEDEIFRKVLKQSRREMFGPHTAPSTDDVRPSTRPVSRQRPLRT